MHMQICFAQAFALRDMLFGWLKDNALELKIGDIPIK
jgi:hypothetical protein